MARLDFPEEVKLLVEHLKRLPGVGPKSAERIAVWLLAQPGGFTGDLANAISGAGEAVRACTVCGFFESSTHGCALCADTGRDSALLCVVEQPTDVLPLERTGAFKGSYHCLGGRIAPLENVGPDDLRIDSLLARAGGDSVREVILGVGSDVEGEATANYLAEIFATRFPRVEVTRLAQGLPAGGGLDNADELTLYRALDGRRKL
jgi:recombination protein RecR